MYIIAQWDSLLCTRFLLNAISSSVFLFGESRGRKVGTGMNFSRKSKIEWNISCFSIDINNALTVKSRNNLLPIYEKEQTTLKEKNSCINSVNTVPYALAAADTVLLQFANNSELQRESLYIAWIYELCMFL